MIVKEGGVRFSKIDKGGVKLKKVGKHCFKRIKIKDFAF